MSNFHPHFLPTLYYMKGSFIANVSFLIFVNLLVKPVWIFGIDLSVQNLVGAERYGIYISLFNAAFILQIILDVGISNFNSRSIAQNKQLLAAYAPSILLLKVLLTVLYIAISLLLGYYYLHYTLQELYLLSFLCINQVLLSFITYFRSNLQGLHLFRQDSLLSVLDRCTMILICSFLLFYPATSQQFNIYWFVYVQTVGYTVAAIVSVFLNSRQLKKISFTWQPTLLKQLIKQSYPFALVAFFMSIYSRIDIVMLKTMMPDIGNTEAGIYGAAYRLLDAANMIGALIATLLLPMFAKMIKEQNNINNLCGFSAKTTFVVASTVSILCFTYAEPLMYWLYVDADAYYVQIFQLLIINFTTIAAVYVYGVLLSANNNMLTVNLIAISGAAINITLNIYLIPKHAAWGACMATLITQFYAAIAYWLAAYKLLQLQTNIIAIIKAIVFVALIYAIAQYSVHLAVVWQLKMLLLGMVGVGLSCLIKLITVRQLKEFLNTKR